MAGDNEPDYDGQERNELQLDNTLWNVIGVDKSDWDREELNVLKCEGFNMERDVVCYDESDQDGLEWNISQHYNAL